MAQLEERLRHMEKVAGSNPVTPTLESRMAKCEKMSKSRGNVVLPEEVVYGVLDLDPGYEFRDKYSNIVDWRHNVWRDKGKSGDFFTATRFGRQPVFLCEKGDPRHCILLIDGQEKEQHPGLPEEWVEYYAFLTKEQAEALRHAEEEEDEKDEKEVVYRAVPKRLECSNFVFQFFCEDLYFSHFIPSYTLYRFKV